MMNTTAEIREFFDPHPGFGGPTVPLPTPFKTVADSLAGQQITIKEAVNTFKKVAQRVGGVIEAEENWILLHYPRKWNPLIYTQCHCWVLIRHRSPNTEST